MACRDWAAKVGGGVLGRVWALVAALALLLGLAAMAPAPAQAASFKDVPSGQWYTSWVDKASDQGLMSGFTDPATGRPTGYFGPDEPLTRAQVATVLWRMAGGPSSGHASFPDVERGSWYDAPVAWCVKAGVVTGYTSGPDEGHFRPSRPVTRQELATMVYRYAKYAGMDVADPDPSAFRSTTDWRTADSWASEALTWTAAAGVLSGVDNHDGTYSVVPFGTATRAMAAKVFVVLSGSPSAAKASYTVTFDSNGGSSVKAQTVKNGAKAPRPADPAKSGYLFKGWYSDKSLTKAFNFNSTVRSNLTLYAKWEANECTVTFVSNGGTSVAKQTVAYGAKASKPSDPTLEGSQFAGWYADVACTEAYDFSLPVKANLTLYAKWEKKAAYTVTFNVNGGTAVEAQTVKNGAKASKPADPAKAGHAFKGWYSDKSLTKAYDFDSAVESDLTLYAKWGASAPAASYTVVFDSNGGSSVMRQVVAYGTKVAKPFDPTLDGNEFAGWYTDFACTKAYDFSLPVKSDLTLYAKWEANEYTVTFDSNGGSAVEAQSVSSGARASRPADPTLDGSQFAGWYADAALTEAYDFGLPVKANLTLYAKWDANEYTVTFVSNGGTSVSRQTVSYGARASRPADPTLDGHAFKGWYTDKSLTEAYDFGSAVESDLALYAKWDANECTVTFVSNGGTSVSRQTVAYGARASRPSDPTLDGNEFAGWYTDAACTEAYDFGSAVKSDLTLYAKWEKKATYTVTFDSNGGTAVEAQAVSSGARASRPADPAKAGHAFKGWYTDKSLAEAYDFGSAVESDLALYAKWEANEYTVTFVSNGGTSVSRQTVAYGAKASRPSDPTLDGNEFAGWYTDAACTEAYDFGSALKSDLTLYAKWEKKAYAVLYGDGLLSLQAGDDTDLSHGGVLGEWAWDGSSRPWYDKRSRVRSVVARDRVAVSNGHRMFSDLGNCESVDLSKLDVSNASNLCWMFRGCSSLTSLDVSGWDVSGASDLSSMFRGCSSLTSLDVSGWDVSGASGLSGMFYGCSRLQSLDVSGWDVSGASGLSSMFWGCSSLTSLDVSGWDVSGASDLSSMFWGCSSLSSVTLGTGCGRLIEELPSGPWYDAEGKEYDRPPAGVAGTFTKTKPAALAVAADAASDAGALPPAQIVEGEQDGLRYVVVPEGAAFEYGIEYLELAGRYVGPGVYLTGYAGESDSLVVPLEVAGVPVVSANLSWNDSDRAGMTRLASISFERVEGKVSSLAQLDVSGNGLSSLDIEGLDALVRLNCEGNPIADLVALQAWAAQDGHEAKLPQAQDVAPAEPGDAAAPSEPSTPEQPSEPDVPSVEPGKPSEPEVPAEPEAPSEPSEPGVPSEPEAPATPEAPSEPEEPSVEPTPDEGSADEPAASDEADPASDSLALGEDPDPALAA